MFDFETVEKAFFREAQAQSTYQQGKSRYGNLFQGSDIESILEYKLCALRDNKDKVGAIFFDDWKRCEDFVKANENYTIASFKEFKSLTNGKWKNPDLYYLDKNNDVIVFAED